MTESATDSVSGFDADSDRQPRTRRGLGPNRIARGERANFVVVGPDGQPIGRGRRPQLAVVQPLTAATDVPGDALVAACAAADLFARASLARSTWESYASHWADWEAWCAEHQVSALPAQPAHVAAHLATLAVQHGDQGQVLRDAEGRLLPGRLKAVTVSHRLAAINKFHEWAEQARPGDDTHVRRVMAGIRRSFGVYAQEQKAALTLRLLTQLLDLTYEPDLASIRDMAAALLCQQPNVSLAELVSLDWASVEMTDGTVGWRNAAGVVRLITRGRNPTVCAVQALGALKRLSGGHGRVFQHLQPYRPDSGRVQCGLWQVTGRPFTRQGLTALIRRRIVEVGLEVPEHGLPHLAGAELLRLSAHLSRPTSTVLRDRALLLTGWVGAMRRSNLSWLEWRDVSRDGREYAALLRFQKNDQVGKGHTVYLVRGDNPRTDPVAAWEAWRARVAEELGVDEGSLPPRQAVFVPLDRHGNLGRDSTGRLRRLSADSINSVVQRYVAAAGMDVHDFGAHSLRAGFITEGAERGVPVTDLQAVSGHRSTDMVMRYIRMVDRRLKSPARRMGL